jgi:drug/metabolite transporter (DMT)-like permease
LTPIQWTILGYVFAMLFGIVAIINPTIGYQILGMTLAFTGLFFGGILAYRVFASINEWRTIPFSKLTLVIALVALSIFFVWIPLVTLRQTLSIAFMIGLFGLAAYHLYFIRQKFINPLNWKNYAIGITSLLGGISIFLFMNTISDLLMMGGGLAIILYGGYQLMMIVIKKN